MRSANRARTLRRYVRWIWIYFLHFSGLLRWAQNKTVKSGGVIVLTLHRVLPRREFETTLSPRGMVVSVETFKGLLQFLKNHCEVLDLVGDCPHWKGHHVRPRVAVTFDDGWKDTAEIAAPLLQRDGIPFAVFICPGLVGKQLPFWPERVALVWKAAEHDTQLSDQFASICRKSFTTMEFSPFSRTRCSFEQLLQSMKELPSAARDELVQELLALAPAGSDEPSLDATMGWEETRTVAQSGGQIGSHTIHHEILTSLPRKDALREISHSKFMIEDALGAGCNTFAYPNGDWAPEIQQIVAEQGYSQAFINRPGIWTSGTNRWLIPRVNIWEGSVTNSKRRFSSVVLKYSVFWLPYWVERMRRNSNLT